jgi:broad specificity phosphatase PhoE
MQRICDAYLTHRDDRLRWVYRFWLDLTDKGEHLAPLTEQGRRVARDVEEQLARRTV